MSKEELRIIARKNRIGLDTKKISNIIVNNIINSNVLNNYNNIGIYYPIHKEINPLELINSYPDKEFYLPRINKNNELEFAEYSTRLILAKFGTLEPDTDSIEITKLDCIIIPCVAISNNRRIGYGKGYYDRALKNYKGYKIGLVYQNAIFNEELDEYDLLLDKIFSA